MEEQQAPQRRRHRVRSGEERLSFLKRIKKKFFLTPEERYERRRHRRRRTSFFREYIKRVKASWAYKRYQRRELSRKKRHRKAAVKLEKAPWYKNTTIQRFFKKFTRESRPYYYYAETDQPKSEVQRQRKRLLHFAVNSSLLYLITFIITYCTYQMLVMFVASRFGINSIFYFYEVYFPIGNNNNSGLWSDFNIILITFSGPFICVLLGIYFLLIHARKETTKGLKKLFFLWLSFHYLNFFMGAFVGGVITHQGFGYVIEWLYMPTFLRFGLALLFLFGMGVIGYFQTEYFLESSNSIYWTQRYKKPWLILFGALVPWAFGSVFLFMLRYPFVIPQHETIVVYDTIIYMTMVFFIAPMLVNFKAKPMFDQTVRKARGRRINWVYVVLFVLITVVFRVGLDGGFSYFIFK